jgi:hypothetical protein
MADCIKQGATESLSMGKIQPSEPRSTILEEGERLTVIIPVQRHWSTIIGLGVWLCVCSAVLVFAGFVIRAGIWPVGIFLIIWSAAGCCFWYYQLRSICGREIWTISAADKSFCTRFEFLGIGKSRQFNLKHVHDLRASLATYDESVWRRSWSVMGLGYECIAFGYGPQSYRAGYGLDEAEARIIVEHVLQRFPELGGPTDLSSSREPVWCTRIKSRPVPSSRKRAAG